MNPLELIPVHEIESVCDSCGLAISHGFGCPAKVWIAKAREIYARECRIRFEDQPEDEPREEPIE